MTVDPKHIEAVARAQLSAPWPKGSLGEWATNERAERLLTSTDPAVHAALLAALVRAGVLTEVTISRRACGCRAESFAAMCCRQSSDTPNTTERRYVTRWEDE